MNSDEKCIQILPEGKIIKARAGASLLDSLMLEGIFLRADCGGKGRCQKCRVLKKNDTEDFKSITACTYKVKNNISIKIPGQALISSHILDKPPVIFPESFRQRIELKKNKKKHYGAAVDLGTTTIAVYLCYMSTGEILGSIALKNPQSIFGEDVISRINAVSLQEQTLEHLQRLAVSSIEWGLEKLFSALHIKANALSLLLVVGNPTMIHLLAGINPAPIGIAPYQPVFYDAKLLDSVRLGFQKYRVDIQTLPQKSGFIGGDILAASLAVEMDQQADGTILIDLGTNGELILKNKDGLFATSCATGPVFEGAQMTCGMQATPGAVHKILINRNQNIEKICVIGSEENPGIRPAGICGAGIINAVAQLCSNGILESSGSFRSGQTAFHIIKKNLEENQRSVFISQKDIRAIQFGKSALITGIEFLLKEARLEYPEKILIAGGFGNHLDKDDIIRLGMIPKINKNKIKFVGNAAGTGAVMALNDPDYIEKLIRQTKNIKSIELSCNVEFQQRFIENLSFPSRG